jgi:citrate synthase
MSADNEEKNKNNLKVHMKESRFFYDPGYANTASCKSSITFIDGDKGILRYRGYDILEIAQKKDYISTVYLLFNGEFPNENVKTKFAKSINSTQPLPKEIANTIESFSACAHPMQILVAAFAALSSVYKKISQQNYKDALLIYTPKIIAYIHRFLSGQAQINAKEDLSYCNNFLHMMSGTDNKEYAKALDTILLLHADHEQNASTATARMVVSCGTDPILAVSAATASLSGHLHGGANEAVISMLEEIQSGKSNANHFIQLVKDKKAKLMGFGHRVYKSYDPRAKILAEVAKKFLDDDASELFKIAKQLESSALNDKYFVSRKLYPNVDFYSGIILRAIGIPKNMFTPIFALARVCGWAAQISEMLTDKEQKICRPRQIYVGNDLRKIDF